MLISCFRFAARSTTERSALDWATDFSRMPARTSSCANSMIPHSRWATPFPATTGLEKERNVVGASSFEIQHPVTRSAMSRRTKTQPRRRMQPQRWQVHQLNHTLAGRAPDSSAITSPLGQHQRTARGLNTATRQRAGRRVGSEGPSLHRVMDAPGGSGCVER